jgi:non-ribosomal peptide synthetase component F
MTYAPDFGLAQLRGGVGPGAAFSFYSFRLFSLTVLARAQYSTMVVQDWAGIPHALSLDFNEHQLQQILTKGPPALSELIRAELSRDSVTPRAIEFEGFIEFGVRARLGPVQTVSHEQFAPLIAEEIL